MGRSDLFLKLEIIKKIIGLIILVIAMNYGVFAICLSVLVYNAIVLIINTFPNRKLLNYSYLAQLKDVFPSIALSLIMSVSVYFMQNIKLPIAFVLIIQIIAGAVIYICFSVLFKLDTFKYVLDTVKSMLKIKKI